MRMEYQAVALLNYSCVFFLLSDVILAAILVILTFDASRSQAKKGQQSTRLKFNQHTAEAIK